MPDLHRGQASLYNSFILFWQVMESKGIQSVTGKIGIFNSNSKLLFCLEKEKNKVLELKHKLLLKAKNSLWHFDRNYREGRKLRNDLSIF